MRSQNIITAVFCLAGVTISIVRPKFLSDNKFLSDFINHEYINILAVIVTVSMVSVVQLHLEYTRIERRFKAKVFQLPRKAINDAALLLTSLLVFAFILSFLRASFTGIDTFVSVIFTLALATILEAIFAMYGLVQTACVLAEDEPIEDDLAL